MDFLEKLKQDPNCLYIYNWGLYIYGLSKEPTDYLVIVKNDWSNDDFSLEEPFQQGFYHENNIHYHLFNIDYWFQKVLNGDLDCWECACLNKKFIVKEHVKLMMTTNPITLRNYIDLELVNKYNLTPDNTEYIWNVIKDCKFANQIIENHKIINFKEANKDYFFLQNTLDISEAYNKLIFVPYQRLKQNTDELIKKKKIERLLRKKNNKNNE